jgi:hypothetical protein
MAEFRWVKRDDGALCMDGYPIRIERGVRHPFRVVSDWHKTGVDCGALDYAKKEAKRLAVEIYEFNNPEQDGAHQESVAGKNR